MKYLLFVISIKEAEILSLYRAFLLGLRLCFWGSRPQFLSDLQLQICIEKLLNVAHSTFLQNDKICKIAETLCVSVGPWF